jgi:uncharacterized protein (DUF433 family)
MTGFFIIVSLYKYIQMTQKKNIGRFIVSDPKICHGKLTFKGTRIFVDDVLEMVAEGFSWNYIQEQWNGKITKDAIREAVATKKLQLLQS